MHLFVGKVNGDHYESDIQCAEVWELPKQTGFVLSFETNDGHLVEVYLNRQQFEEMMSETMKLYTEISGLKVIST
jgi:hypothetical protein